METAETMTTGLPTRRFPLLLCALLLAPLSVRSAPSLRNDAYAVTLAEDGSVQLERDGLPTRLFTPQFLVLCATNNPAAELRWGDTGDQRVLYNIKCWQTTPAAKAKAKQPPAAKAHVEDGFDPGADRAAGDGRTFDAFRAAPGETVRASQATQSADRIEWTFPDAPNFSLRATLSVPSGAADPLLEFTFTPRRDGWFSIAYVGAPACESDEAEDVWQPMIWQERRFPKQPFLTEAGRCTLPTALVTRDGVTVGVVADPQELPFMPMPTPANSRFGVTVRNAEGRAQPALFAPTLGGTGSQMRVGGSFRFAMRLFVGRGRTTDAFEQIARGLYAFRDIRRNDGLGSLNRTLERMTDFAMGEWARFDTDLRGSCYDTDVPGAVKNVSALHPLGVALVTDDAAIFTQRARPILEYLLSREKFLFTTHPEVKGQGASSKLKGPCAPLSELAALYAISGRRSPVLLNAAQGLYGKHRVLNLDEEMPGDRWQDAFALWQATGDAAWLAKTRRGADRYLQERMETPQTTFPQRGAFFWTSFAPDWMELCELAAATADQRYLAASREGARRFAQFTWMCPAIPDGEVLVNEGGRAPVYRKSTKLQPILLPEERAPAWRVSELGLTPESSGTCKGHRGVFLATHAPFMLSLAQQTGDAFLHDIARSAIVGRYTSFPGYHMNTARTTVYEKPDFAERPLAQINATSSLHYNHIWPQIALLVDYLVADAAYRSRGAIAFPSHFAEGYGYLKGRIYGDRPGAFCGERDVWLWMPKGLLTFDSGEINYVAGRRGGTLYLALMNQSAAPVSARCALHGVGGATGRNARVWRENKPAGTRQIDPADFEVGIAPRGITVLAIEGLDIAPKFQIGLGGGGAWAKDSAQLDLGGTHALVLNFGPGLQSAYVYLQAGPTEFQQATLRYACGGATQTLADAAFPFEFTVPLPPDAADFRFQVEAIRPGGDRVQSEAAQLAR